MVVHEEKAVFFLPDGPAQAASEDVLFDRGLGLAGSVEEEIVGVEDVVAEVFVDIAMKILCARFQNGVDVAAAVAALARVIERGLDFEFLDDVRIGQGHVRGLRHVVVGRANAFNQVVIVVLALAIHDDAHISAAELRRGVQLALRAGGKSQKLLVVLGRKREVADRNRIDGLTGRGIGRFDAGDLRGDFHFFGHRAGFEGDGDARGFGDVDFDSRGLGFREA